MVSLPLSVILLLILPIFNKKLSGEENFFPDSKTGFILSYL